MGFIMFDKRDKGEEGEREVVYRIYSFNYNMLLCRRCC